MAAPIDNGLSSQSPGLIAVAGYESPFSTRCRTAEIEEGATLLDIVRTIDLAEQYENWLRVEIDGRSVPRKLWSKTRPKPGTVVVAQVLPAGDRDAGVAKSVITIIAAVALIAVSWGGATVGIPALGIGAGSIGVGTAFGATLAAGSMLYSGISSLAAPAPVKRFDGAVAESTESPALRGAGNVLGRYQPLDRIFGEVRHFPKLAAKPYTEIVGNEQYLRMLFTFGYGPLQLEEHKLGETDLATFSDVEYNVLPGYDDDPPLSIFTSSVDEVSENVELIDGQPAIVRQTRPDATECSIDFLAPLGLICFDKKKGDPGSVTIRLQVAYAPSAIGPFTPVPFNNYELGPGLSSPGAGELDVSGQIRGSVTRGIRFHFPNTVPSGWLVYITRASTTYGRSNYDPNTAADELRFVRFRSIRPGTPPKIPNLALVEMRIRATDQLNGVVQNYNAKATSILPIWSDAEPVNDGWGPPEKLASNLSLQPTRSPAWAYAEVLRGLCCLRPQKNSKIDGPSLAAWAVKLENDGRNYDGVFDYSLTIREALAVLAGSARARPALIDGRRGVVIDEPKPVVAHLSSLDTWGFQSTRVFRQMPHALRVDWKNPGNGYQPEELVVYNDGFDESNATEFDRLDLTAGHTDPEWVQRDGRYHLAATALRPEMHSFMTELQSLRLTQGDRFRYGHEVIRVTLVHARIQSIDYQGTEITGFNVDTEIPWVPGIEHGVRIRTASDETMQYRVKNYAGTQILFTVETPFGDPLPDTAGMTRAPAVGDMVSIGELGHEVEDYLVHTVIPTTDFQARVEFVDYSPAIFTADTEPIPPYVPKLSPLPHPQLRTPAAPAIDSIASDESVVIVNVDGTIVPVISVSVSQSPNVDTQSDYFQLQYRTSNPVGEWISGPAVDARTNRATVEGVDEGVAYDLRVRSVSSEGIASDWSATVLGHVVIGASTLPPDIENLRIEPTRRLVWDYTEPPRDLAGFVIKTQAGNVTNWATGVPLHEGVITTQEYFVAADKSPGLRTFMIKAIDLSGNESANALYVIIDMPDTSENVIEEYDDRAAGFPGTKTNCTVDGGGDLVSDTQTGSYWPADDLPFWRQDSELFWQDNYLPMTYEFEWNPPDTALPGTVFIDIEITSEAWSMFYREQGSTAWLTWSGSLIALPGITYEFKVETQASTLESRITALRLYVDVPDISENINDFYVASSGTVRLPITESYRVIKNVLISLQAGVGQGVVVLIEDKDATLGPSIYIERHNGTRTDGVVDATVLGY